MFPSFQNKKVLVMGLGLNGGGVSVAKFFAQCGSDVLVTDLKTESELKKSLNSLKKFPSIKYRLGEHSEDDFKNVDLVIKNPAVPFSNRFIKIARENNVPVETDISVFFNLCPGRIIGITGTKGKSTVTSLIYFILKEKSKDTVLAGNIGVSPLEFLRKIKETTNVVLELSSFELEKLKKSPHIAVITALYPDHLDRYKTFKKYIDSKKSIFSKQNKNDFLVLDFDNLETKKLVKEAKSNVLFYSTKVKKDGYLKDDFLFFKNGKIIKVSELKIFGDHNISNALAAISVAKILNIENEFICKALKSFTGVPHRQEFIKEVGGVKYFNDTAATMPNAVVAAIKTFKSRFPKSNLTLIAGGQDKGLDYKDLKKQIKANVDSLVLLPGTGSEKIIDGLKTKNIYNVISMAEAVKKASEISKPGDIVILSPGAASFNLFKNEFDRGEKFVSSVKRLR